MRTRTLPTVLRLAGLAALLGVAGCATTSPAYHQYVMRGQVLTVAEDSLTLCIGASDGARVGQVLDVVRHVPRQPTPKESMPVFRRQEIGEVRITGLFDEHYATAVILAGDPLVSDSVELKRY